MMRNETNIRVTLSLCVVLVCLILGFQNCNEGFRGTSAVLQSQSPAPIPVPTPTPTPVPTPTPPAARKVRIMPLGDSITQGIGSSSCHSVGGCGGYRTVLYQHLTSQGLSFDFVGSQSSGPANLPDQDHEGHGGWRIDQISANIQTWLSQATPDVVLLHIGTNDIVQQYELNTAGGRLEHLVNQIFAVSPNVSLFLAYVVPIQGSPDGWDVLVRNYNMSVESIIVRNQQAGRRIYGSNMYPYFDQSVGSAYYDDTVHPSDAGYAKMAEIWNAGIYNYFPTF